MHEGKKGQQFYLCMKCHIGVDTHSKLVHTVRGTGGNVSDGVKSNTLLHGQETDMFADAGYQSAGKRADAKAGVNWHIAMRPGKRRALDKSHAVDALIDKARRSRPVSILCSQAADISLPMSVDIRTNPSVPTRTAKAVTRKTT